jgi:hypothetical protein
MPRKRSKATAKRDFDENPSVQPGQPPHSPPLDPGLLEQPRQSGRGRAPPHGQETFRPKDTGRRGA